MKPFLYKVAEANLEYYKDTISEQIFVFPNRRAGIFFQKYLAMLSEKPMFSPQITTVNDLFRSFTSFRVCDRINLLFKLYHLYISISKSSETFDEFAFWGEMILNDFDDVDKYVVNARQLFSNIRDLKEIDNGLDGLTEEQIAAIKEFWYNFRPEKQGKTKDDFLSTWEILYPLYQAFREELETENNVYEGMIFREVAERIIHKEALDLPKGKIIFVGLNALSRTEEILLEYLQKEEAADFYWDIESPQVVDEDNRSSLFINRYSRQFPSLLTITKDKETTTPNIELIGIPSATGLAKQVYEIVEKWIKDGHIADTEKAINTAIVLPDEQLLLPTLYAIPESISTINVTMGYPLASSPIAGLMEHLFAMQENWRMVRKQPAFYYRFLLPVLNHRYITNLAPEACEKIYQNILSFNRIFIETSDFEKNPLLSKIFKPVKSGDDIAAYLMEVLEQIQKHYKAQYDENEEDESEKMTMSNLEREFIYHYYITVSRMREVMAETDVQMSSDTFFRLLRQMVTGVSIPFQGEPLSGLQVMGVLETRALDFENIIILSMNEGVFPLRGATNSFIPYNLRVGFGLTTFEHQDSVYAYHFYRMIYRAKNISLLYDTRSEGMQTGEVSRYLHQMKYHYRMPIAEKLITYDISLHQNRPIAIEKNERIQQQLQRFLESGDRALSASAINTYLDCPLKFYFQEIEKISEEEEVSEELEANQFGSMFHRIMENIYEPMKNRVLQAETLEGIQKNHVLLDKEVENAFMEFVFKTDKPQELTGNNFLIGAVLKRYVQQVLEVDRKLTPFTYRASEERIEDIISTDSDLTVKLKGSIDRVDEVNEITRIIDYKTGAGVSTFNELSDLFNSEQKKRPKAVMQVFLYAWLYKRKYKTADISPGIYYLREIFGDFDPIVAVSAIKGKKEKVEDFNILYADFEQGLKNCLDEIFNLDKKFVQTGIEEHCTYCSFKEICRK
ncbi:PD-(D/E)XK nuclease family protein [Parabacteroides sp. FAFU027]|uniref:PD-(D/E)XK nuclease family protein n=1 Tax=Parabacteroides sp. FAFU027 TaxID=2922715 RepID=UPI001FAFC054|nr:PD-(D/E)XK nuclease family protein [Parabacteroides sp. FAFU027]